jgi:hypothetical protein
MSELAKPIDPREREPVTAGSRVAGGVFLVNAALGLVGLYATWGPMTNAFVIGQRVGAGAMIVFQIVAGAALLRGRPGARALVAVPIALCILVAPMMIILFKSYLLATSILIFCGSLVLLIAGTPGKARIATGVILAGMSHLVTAVGSRGSAAGAQAVRGEMRPGAAPGLVPAPRCGRAQVEPPL